MIPWCKWIVGYSYAAIPCRTKKYTKTFDQKIIKLLMPSILKFPLSLHEMMERWKSRAFLYVILCSGHWRNSTTICIKKIWQGIKVAVSKTVKAMFLSSTWTLMILCQFQDPSSTRKNTHPLSHSLDDKWLCSKLYERAIGKWAYANNNWKLYKTSHSKQ